MPSSEEDGVGAAAELEALLLQGEAPRVRPGGAGMGRWAPLDQPADSRGWRVGGWAACLTV